MGAIEHIIGRMAEYGGKTALYWQGRFFSYKDMLDLVAYWDEKISSFGIKSGDVCAVKGDFSPNACALFFALMKRQAVLVPFSREIENQAQVFSDIAGVEHVFSFDRGDGLSYAQTDRLAKARLVGEFLARGHAGLIVFSSGSTGAPKGILQDCENVAQKFLEKRKGWRTVFFLMMDHFGGFNTFLSSFAYGGAAVLITARTPEAVCAAIESAKADLLPTTPTFLNFLMASGCHKKYDVSSIRLVTYGTEMMNETTLKRAKAAFPQAQFKQTYGLSELGVLRSKSESDGSVWLKVGGREFDTKIVNNILWIKSQSNMAGYLNAPNPFDGEGWFCTGDEVEARGEYIRFVGRKTEIINVGGQKVFPAEIEAVILEDENVAEVTVVGRKHPLMGEVPVARLSLKEPEDWQNVSARLRKLCNSMLAKYKTPVKFEIVESSGQYSERFKKIRRERQCPSD
jgi:acyl-coenzyme A synthetase/AMP-(fatty) acid ligase